MFRVGEISYLNCTPLFTVLRSSYANDGYSFVSGHPSELNAKLRSGEIDLCPSSSIEYAQNPDKYLILPDLSISSKGAVKSVLLFSALPIEALDGVSIGLTGESETSVILLKILLTMKYSFANSYYKAAESDQSIYSGHDALLLIGDRALAEASKFYDAHVYDLGELWQEFTGLPFVFALWLLREDSFHRSPQTVRLLHERFVCSKERAIASFNEISQTTKQNIWDNPSFLINYWNIISYDLTKEHIEGVKLFYRYAAKCGFIESEPQLRMLEWNS
ncbi:MAG: menaquinone biosynthesis protein [Geobacteraceae bacterium]|nr:menaquinone biosynthesis protein [Geobacteraceae bacterium]